MLFEGWCCLLLVIVVVAGVVILALVVFRLLRRVMRGAGDEEVIKPNPLASLIVLPTVSSIVDDCFVFGGSTMAFIDTTILHIVHKMDTNKY